METHIGVTQFAFQGTPISSCLAVVGTGSACQWAEGRGNFVNLTRNADGSISKGDVVHDARTDPTGADGRQLRPHDSVPGEVPPDLRSQHLNIFNQRATAAVREQILAANLVSPTRASRFPGDPGVDWGKVMNGYNYVDALNGRGSFQRRAEPADAFPAIRYALSVPGSPQDPAGAALHLLNEPFEKFSGDRETGPLFLCPARNGRDSGKRIPAAGFCTIMTSESCQGSDRNFRRHWTYSS